MDYKGYVEKLIEYSTGDVEYLLEKFKEDVEKNVRRHAGPLLMVVMNGIDTFRSSLSQASSSADGWTPDRISLPPIRAECLTMYPIPMALDDSISSRT